MTSPTDPLSQIRAVARTVPPALAIVAEWVLRHPAEGATLGIEEIAAQAGTSPASVNRLARAAGYSGFIELKSALASVMRSLVDPVQKLRDEQHRSKLSPPEQYIAMARANLEQLARANPEGSLLAAAKLMNTPGHVYVLGLGLTSHVCAWFADAIQLYVQSVLFVAGPGGTERGAARMSRIGKGDVLVAASLARYSRDTISLARYARDRGASVLAIVDSHAAPLAQEADLLLLAPSSHPMLPASYVALQMVCESLVAEVMRLNPKAVALASERTNSLVPYLVSSPPSSAP